MNKTIWKFELQIRDELQISMPEDAEILSLQVDEKTNTPCIWALLYPHHKQTIRYFELYGTGHPIAYDMGVQRNYIGTFQIHNGAFVGHLFERV